MRDLIPATCKYGCKKNIKSKDIKNHEETCQKRYITFRPAVSTSSTTLALLNCADLECKAKMLMKNLIRHIETCHPDTINHDQESGHRYLGLGTKVLQDDCQVWLWQALRFKSNLDYFFLETVKQTEGTWIIWLYYSGFAQDAAKYTCTIRVHHPDQNLGSVAYSGDVVSMTVDRKTVEKEGMGLTLSKYVVKQLVCDDELKCSISVSKKLT
jgi:hypothetical protein